MQLVGRRQTSQGLRIEGARHSYTDSLEDSGPRRLSRLRFDSEKETTVCHVVYLICSAWNP